MSAAHDYFRVLFTRKNGRHFLGYFFVAADKEVTRHKGETTNQKNNNPKQKKTQ